MKKLRVGTVFTGIGAFEESLKQLKIPFDIVFASDNGERYLNESDEKKMLNLKAQSDIEKLYIKYGKNHIKETYNKNFDIEKGNWHEDVRVLNGNKYFSKIDILVGGSPCQAFSSIGKRKGFNDARGTLFFEYARILSEAQPKYFIYENVPGIKTIDGGKTWNRIGKIFNNLDYNIEYLELNSVDFGYPHIRKRVFVVGKQKKYSSMKLNIIKTNKIISIDKFLIKNDEVEDKYFLGEKGFKFVTNPKYKNRATIDRKILRTLKATQQYNWNGNFIFWETLKFRNHEKIYTGVWKGKKGVIRKMLPKELISLMGFKNYELPKHNDKILYRHSGNSIAVPVIKEIARNIWEDHEKN